MAKDILNNTLKIGDKVIFNGSLCTIKEIHEKRIFGGKMTSSTHGTSLKIPDTMILEFELTYDEEKPMNMFAVRTPPESGAAEA